MYIREVIKKNRGSDKEYKYHRLIESFRGPKGPRQRTVLELGTLELDTEQLSSLAIRIEEHLNGQRTRLVPFAQEIEDLAKHFAGLIIKKRLEQTPAEPEDAPFFQSVDVNSIETSHPKSVGGEHVGLAAMNALDFTAFFRANGFSESQAALATLLIIGRLIHPSSERELKRFAQNDSALDLLMGEDFSRISQNALYRASDKLFEHKDALEAHLRAQANALFSLKETIILYDLTNTYFEGDAPKVGKAKRGWSKEKRFDRPLVTLGLVLDDKGFPKQSKVLAGNASEPATLKEMIATMRSNAENAQPTLLSARPTIVMDAGVATQANCDMLRAESFDYIVVARKRPGFESTEHTTVSEVRKGVTIESARQGDELILCCRSEGKIAKEQAMLDKIRKRMEGELTSLHEGLSKKGKLKNYAKVLERIGRIRERNQRVSLGFDIVVAEREGRATAISWTFDATKLAKPYDGSYFLRTTRLDLAASDIWSIYTMLTTVEDSFRSLKSELGMRPIHHTKEERVESHLFISVLAYHLLSYIQHHLRDAGIQHRWKTLRSRLCMHQAVTATLNKEEGGKVAIRHCTTPSQEIQEIYSALGLKKTPLRRRTFLL